MRPVGSKYLLEEPLGRGATGTVWRARQREAAGAEAAVPGEPGESVAIKVLKEELASDPDVVMRFLRERSVLLRLTHANIVRVRDLVVEGDLLALVMDLVDGPDLHRYLRENGPFSAVGAALLTAQIADALAASHADGVIHRDLKPANVLLADGPDGMRPMLTDFGIARLADSPGITRTHEFVGTPAYVAPESAEGRQQTPAVDVYGAGILLYELVSGRPPFGGGTTIEVLHRHLTETPQRPEHTPDPLWTVVERCLRKRPEERPSADDLARALRTVAAGLSPDADEAARAAALGVGALLGAAGAGRAAGDADPTQVLPAGAGHDPNAATSVLPATGPDADPTSVLPATGGVDGRTAVMPPLPDGQAAGQGAGAAQGGDPHPWQSQMRAARDRNEQTQYQPLTPDDDPLRRRPRRQPAPQPQPRHQPPPPQQQYQQHYQPQQYQPYQQGYDPAADQRHAAPHQPESRRAEPRHRPEPRRPEPRRQEPRRPEPRRYDPPPAPEPRRSRQRGANPMRIPGLGCLKGCLFMVLILAATVALVWNFTPVPEWVAQGRGFWETMVDWFNVVRDRVAGSV
ncbi:serine/threonine-protein kinase [Streptomyces alkaliterrae]|uniref:non-specific serine/threonine protein kinase n=1 Tax=Streptomyces alkaliterrae TaxID=2213162 RepID=A0A5P0YLX1_9ACTN|nr:serine/threonine-protein kinase [Streptomyces alkaliterrae]MBB1261379.1 serine/threonine protein kinase [Streptomyces alkaliterrae]MQS00637.1 protein kinase [Streptomyces alkaliterrae]